ncbi:MAG: hypothetical protein U0793_30900 [Gemmataceae bacterium]
MNWQVLWLPPALNDLARIWTGAADRAVVTKAANQIDHSLEQDPIGEGESRDADIRIIVSLPLGASYRIVPGTRTVEVIHLWFIKKRKA